jgi:hypothetical protein
MKCIQSEIDPCVFFKKNDERNLELIAVCHVDDQIVCGTSEARRLYKEGIKNRFKFLDLGTLKKHLGIWYEWKTDENGDKILIGRMPKLVDQIIKMYEDHVGYEIKEYGTPGTPGFSLTKNKGEQLDTEKYRSIVGKYMYLVTKLFTEGSNTARELTRHFSNPGEDQWKELERAVGYLKVNKENVMLTYRKPKEMRPTATVDTNYATNKDDRRSVSGAIFTLGGCITNWFSKTQKTVTLSSTEAEYVGVSKAAQEILFMLMLLDEFGECKRPALILEDNEGAIFLVKNQSVGERTKHIDVRYHFMRQHYERGDFGITYIMSEDNESDICTKNTPERTHKKHAVAIRDGEMMIYKYWDNFLKDAGIEVQREDVKDSKSE